MDKIKLLLVLIVSAIGVTGAEAADQRMNVRFLAADDPNSWLLEDADRYAGKVVAPNLRRLAGRHDVREDLADYLGEARAWDGMFNELMEELKAQVRNVAADSGYAKVLRELTDRMMRELRDTGDPRVLGDGSAFDQKPFVDPGFVPPSRNKKILTF
ncbi:hypothetical protein [Stieleria varia]|uniref:Uncharacterized protein n=1 Tax=Stieleria varia TaxID=2528005 RepID=A0A5C6AXN6_9BACT|nr:hypothetical protein [Stieleria varia]TWU04775.1 hypothetical protein Pla52n_28190 [Stieleria varia]